MYGPHVAILLMCVSRNTRRVDFLRVDAPNPDTPGLGRHRFVVPITTGLLSGERVVSRMSLGRKYSMYGSFKGAPRTQFRGFHAATQLHCLCKASNFGRP